MGTPLYKNMKTKGTTFYAFPSSSQDSNSYDINFTKFILLNIPQQSGGTDQTLGVMNFNKSDAGPRFYNFQPDGSNALPSTFGEQLVESLRNYVANNDACLRDSRINANTDFYNINEKTSPTEMIFWKWCRKLNLIDYEPALNQIDWNKNLPKYINNNSNNPDYFNQYLWKERDVNVYDCVITGNGGSNPIIEISQLTKYKIGDNVILSGSTLSGVTYKIKTLSFPGNTGTTMTLDTTYIGGSVSDCKIYLNYNKLVQYIGEVQSTSKVQTSKRSCTEITIQIPHQAGQTPTVLFSTYDNSNYRPGLEMPILPSEQQVEIVGAENTNSPIRLRPQDYPGSYYGYFDSYDKTYKCSDGDKLRKNGDYYGILLSNNIGLSDNAYYEKLTDFNSNNIDGINISFDRDDYLKMNLPNTTISNFDEFNSAYLDAAPKDFEFNAILWYYDIDDGSGNISHNLYGVEFLENPSNDNGDCDYNNQKMTTYKKYVSNGEQDGVSYIFDLNLNTEIDNDVQPLPYDPTTIYNQFGFDLYQNVLQTNAQLQESFIAIVSGFSFINQEITNMKSIIYSQTDIDSLKSQISNTYDLLKLYSTYQFIDSNTAKIETNFDNAYPTLKVNVINNKYSTILNVNTSAIFNYNTTNSGSSYIVAVDTTNQMMLNIFNNNNIFNTGCTLVLNKDLEFGQQLDILIKPNLSKESQTLSINMLYSNNGVFETNLINITLPIDISSYTMLSPSDSLMTNSYYTNNNIYTYSNNTTSGTTVSTTIITIFDNLFTQSDYVYIDNFYLISGTTITDFSGVYNIISYTGSTYNSSKIEISLNTFGYTLKSKPKISYYKGMKINILRVNPSSYSLISDRYQITKELL